MTKLKQIILVAEWELASAEGEAMDSTQWVARRSMSPRRVIDSMQCSKKRTPKYPNTCTLHGQRTNTFIIFFLSLDLVNSSCTLLAH